MDDGNGGVTKQLKLMALKSLRPPFKYIFILSHMRSGSTLLVHLLSSHPKIAGFGEVGIMYRSPAELDELLLKLSDFYKQPRLTQTFALDKLLQNVLLEDRSILNRDDVYPLFLLRDPEQALPSIGHVYTHVYPKAAPHLAGDLTSATEYYRARLACLSDYARSIQGKERAGFITHNQLLTETESVFAFLQNWLHLETPFREEYRTHQATGKAGIGDFSDTIKEGRIVRGEKHEYAAVPPENMQQARAAFSECERVLRQCCAVPSHSGRESARAGA
jgi:hypothetical protein